MRTVRHLRILLIALIAVAFIPLNISAPRGISGERTLLIGDVAHAQSKKKRPNLFELLFKRKKKTKKKATRSTSKKSRTVKRAKKNSVKKTKKRTASKKRSTKRRTAKRNTNNGGAATRRVAAASTTPKSLPKAENAAKVLVIGDFMADGLADGLTVAFDDDPNTVIINAAQGLSGIVRDDVYNWPEETKKLIEEIKPAAVVGLIGMNDRQQMRLTDGRVEKRSDGWNKAYEARVEQLATSMRHNNTPFIWVGIPPVRQRSMNEDYVVFNDLYRVKAEGLGGTFIDVWNGFTNEEGKFIAAGPDINGQIVRLRRSDGINMTRAAKRKLAFFVEKSLKRITGLGADGLLANIDLFRGPIKPFEPEYDPAKSGLTQVVSLADPALDGGEALEGETGFLKSEDAKSSVSYELVAQGMAAKPHTGRIDAAWGPVVPVATPPNPTAGTVSPQASNTSPVVNGNSPAAQALRENAEAIRAVQQNAQTPATAPGVRVVPSQ